MTKGSRISLVLMAAGPLAFYAVFVLLPLVQSIQVSTWDWNGLGEPEFVGLDNFSRALNDRLFVGAFINTALWLVVAVTVPTVLGLLLAVLLDRPLRGSRLYKSAFYMPITLSLVVVGQVWIWIYQPNWGLLNSVLEAVGLEGLTRAWLGDPETALIAVIAAWCWQQTALSLILYLAALTTIPKDLLEAAAIDGATWWQQFRRVMVPLLRPATVVVITLAVINTLKGFDIVFVLTQGGPFHTSDNLAMFMYSETFFRYRVGYGAAIAVALFTLAIIVIVVYFRQSRASERLYG
jgi:multiple sugar transport system permease protein/raffinose/stachyose/melibiose transport system permease protein